MHSLDRLLENWFLFTAIVKMIILPKFSATWKCWERRKKCFHLVFFRWKNEPEEKEIYCFNISCRNLRVHWISFWEQQQRNITNATDWKVNNTKNIFVSLGKKIVNSKKKKKRTWRNATICQSNGGSSSDWKYYALPIGLQSERLTIFVWKLSGQFCCLCRNEFECDTKRYLAKRKLIKLILFIYHILRAALYILLCSQLFITIDVDHNKLNARN